MTEQTNPQVPMLSEKRSPVPASPIHPLAALSTLVLDNIFGLFEIIDPVALVFTSISLAVINGVAVTFVQHYLAKDDWGPAVAKGLVMGIIAGVPFQVAGTAVGIPLLAWAGLHEWLKVGGPKKGPAHLPDSDGIVEVEAKDIK